MTYDKKIWTGHNFVLLSSSLNFSYFFLFSSTSSAFSLLTPKSSPSSILFVYSIYIFSYFFLIIFIYIIFLFSPSALSVTCLGTGCMTGVRSLVGRKMYLFANTSDRLWGPSSLLPRILSWAKCPWNVKLTNHLHLDVMLRTKGALHPSPYTPSWHVV
jgi:hypothetical protein